MSSLYPRSVMPVWVAGFIGVGGGEKYVLDDDMFDNVLADVNKDATPGYPLNLDFPDKGAVILHHRDSLKKAVEERLKTFLLSELPVPSSAFPATLVAEGFCDPVRVFIKNEPHTEEKMAQGRFRLVSCVSICDEIVERYLFSRQNSIEIENWTTIPSKPGMGLSMDSQTQHIFQYAEPYLKDLIKSDVSGWDWSVPGWLFKADLECRKRLIVSSGEHDSVIRSAWERMAHARYACLTWTTFITSGGDVFLQRQSGIMCSGSYLTSSSNSRMRVLLAFITGSTWAMAMGDDCNECHGIGVQTDVERLKDEYLEYGFRIRDVERGNGENFEFCSHRFSKKVAVPSNFWKGAYRLSSSIPSVELLTQFRAVYRNSPELAPFMQVLARSEHWSPLFE